MEKIGAEAQGKVLPGARPSNTRHSGLLVVTVDMGLQVLQTLWQIPVSGDGCADGHCGADGLIKFVLFISVIICLPGKSCHDTSIQVDAGESGLYPFFQPIGTPVFLACRPDSHFHFDQTPLIEKVSYRGR
jgi:hypothetical protein